VWVLGVVVVSASVVFSIVPEVGWLNFYSSLCSRFMSVAALCDQFLSLWYWPVVVAGWGLWVGVGFPPPGRHPWWLGVAVCGCRVSRV